MTFNVAFAKLSDIVIERTSSKSLTLLSVGDCILILAV